MRLSEFKTILEQKESVDFRLPDGTSVPEHFHITEVGLLTRNFIDCGGKLREVKTINIQLWYSTDTEHRLKSDKLLKIIQQSENLIDLGDHEVEIEYQQETISKFGLAYDEHKFVLTPTQTACLAEDQCGIPPSKTRVSLKELPKSASCCAPGTKCC
ncbi:MAG: hypothetical protein RIT43_1127 [Bacteroidota bacterium]|jgi:hypothetical protein